MQTVLDVLKKQIEDNIAESETHLSRGAVGDYAEYREVVGIVRGSKAILNLIDDLQRNLENDDD